MLATPCIHSFNPEHCAACRTCPHGFQTAKCGRCSATTRPSARPAELPRPSEEYQGFEIFFVPVERGWYHRATDGTTSSESFRSAFQARRAINLMLAAKPPASATRAAKRGT
jgi:hypothetical protein